MDKSLRILIPDGDSRLTVKVVTCLALGGYTNIICVGIIKNHRIRYSKYSSYYFIETENRSAKEYFLFVKGLIETNSVDFVLPVTQAGIVFCNEHKEELNRLTILGLMPDVKTLDQVDHKNRLSKYLTENKFPAPRTFIISEIKNFDIFCAEINYPVLLKPIARAGGMGIIKCRDKEDLISSLDKITSDQYHQFVIQEFLEGTDAGFSCLCKNGEILAYTIHKEVLPAYKRYQIPLSIEFIKDDVILEQMSKLVKGLNWNGVFDLDMMIENTSGKIYIIEINPRFWASLYASLNAGINFPDMYLRASLGESFELPDYIENRFIRLKFGMLKRLLFYVRYFKIAESDLKYLWSDKWPIFTSKVNISK